MHTQAGGPHILPVHLHTPVTVCTSRSSPMTAKLTAAQFGSTTFDYIVIGGGTAGLTVAARYASSLRLLLGPDRRS